ncbi:MAG: enoyl-CoA hydratase/isomerase family protein [Rubrivivax sp.]|nr:enoyl-CoA hydratase/isomerase family protein [Rubrivivax sp.]MDP3224441.1 enoyl-CoA hydratase/isomerase family protein [Rubrivivax sp.]
MSAADGPPLLNFDAPGCATITLNRPRHLNRLHREDLLVLQAHFATLAADTSLRAVVITGRGRAFCAGFNLKELGQAEAAGKDPQLFERTVDALEALPVPTVARLNGSVFGGATDLALACDFRIGVAGMELRMPAARLGLHYYPSGLQRYVSRLGLASAKRLFLLAPTVPADELLRMGYLDALADADALDPTVQTWVQPLLEGAPLALRGMKQSLNELARGSADVATLRNREALCAASTDLQEGLAAFEERRAARFRGL